MELKDHQQTVLTKFDYFLTTLRSQSERTRPSGMCPKPGNSGRMKWTSLPCTWPTNLSVGAMSINTWPSNQIYRVSSPSYSSPYGNFGDWTRDTAYVCDTWLKARRNVFLDKLNAHGLKPLNFMLPKQFFLLILLLPHAVMAQAYIEYGPSHFYSLSSAGGETMRG